MVTLKEVAAKSGVSIATVSNILNGKKKVSEETKKRILKIVDELGYKPNYMASRLRANKTKTIGLIIEDITGFSSPLLIDGIMYQLEKNGYRAILENLRFYSKWGNSWYKEEGYYDAVRDAVAEMEAVKVDGIIYVAGHDRYIDSLPSELKIPTVIAYAHCKDKKFPSVTISDRKSAEILTDYLVSKNKHSIAVIAGNKDNIHTERRFLGFMDSLKKHQIDFDENLFVYGNWNREDGYKACKYFFEKKCNFDAIFCFNDLMAAGVYDFFCEKGIVPKKDISVVGFDNREISEYLNPKLTTMEIPLRKIGENSAEELLKILEGQKVEENFPVLCKLLERESV